MLSNVESTIGNTPLVRLARLPGATSNTILAKLEGNNPAGSVKDRPALSMIVHRGTAEVRGRGAMLALELVHPGTLEPDPAAAAWVARMCAAQGVLVLTCGTWGNVIRLLPPLVIDAELLDDALDVLEDVLRAAAGRATA